MECKLDRITIYYESFGEGRPILMLHGWTTDHRWMAAELEPIFQSRTGWQRIYLDLPGRGQTLAPPWVAHQDQVLDIILDFTDRVISGQRFSVAGLSHRGYLARGVVYRRAALIDGVLLIVPITEAELEQRDTPEHVMLVEEKDLLSELVPSEARAFTEGVVVQSRRLLDRLRNEILPAVECADRAFLSRLRRNYAFSFDVDALAEPFAGPALILLGRQDSEVGYRDAWRLVENYPRGTFVVLDRAGHYLPIEQEGLFRTLVNEWLDRVEESTRRA